MGDSVDFQFLGEPTSISILVGIFLAGVGFVFNRQWQKVQHTYDFIGKRFESHFLRDSIRFVIDLSGNKEPISLVGRSNEEVAKIFDVLNYFNAVGLAYQRNHLSRDVIRGQMRHTVVRIWPVTKNIVERYRKDHKVPYSFRGLEWMAKSFGAPDQ